MKDTKFSIKISDILNNAGSSDELTFEKKFSPQLPTLTKEGISGTFIIESLDSESLLGTLTDVRCKINDVCESCQTPFEREVHVPEYIARFVVKDITKTKPKEAPHSEKEIPTDEFEGLDENATEEIFYIDPKNELLDIHDMVVQSVVLQEPIVKRCPACQKKLDDAGDDESLDEFVAKGNINFK